MMLRSEDRQVELSIRWWPFRGQISGAEHERPFLSGAYEQNEHDMLLPEGR